MHCFNKTWQINKIDTDDTKELDEEIIAHELCVDSVQHSSAEDRALLPEKRAATHLPVAQHFSKLKGTSHTSSLESHRVAKASERLSREQYRRVLPY